MRQFNFLATVTMISILSGCGSLGPSPYKEPTEGAMATLVFSKGGHMLVIPDIYTGAAECTDRTKLPPIPNDGEISRKIVAGHPLSFSLVRTENYLGLAACIVTATFTPEPNHRYIAQVKGHETSCHIDLVDDGTPGNEYTRPKAVAKQDRKWHTPLGEHGPFCTD